MHGDQKIAPTQSKDICGKPSGSYRLLHTADWHLGKLLNDRSRDEEHSRFLAWLLGAVKLHEVDAIVLAGDVFDCANPPHSALARYYDFVSCLFRQGGCALVVIAGNHDSAAQLEAPKQALHALNVHVTGFLAEDPSQRILLLPDTENPRIAIALLPFLRERELRVGRVGEGADEIRAQVVLGIRERYKETAAAAEAAVRKKYPILATGHLTVVGASTTESERDIHIGGLGAISPDAFPDIFSYVALGHLHRPQPTDSGGRVRYAGSPIPLSFSEADDLKEVRILDVMQGAITQQSLPVPVFRKLAQIRCTLAGLEEALVTCNKSPGDLRTWIEVVLEDAALEADIVNQLADGLDFDILKIVRPRTEGIRGMNLGEASDDEAIETILDDPTKVFGHLLDERRGLTEEEREKIKTTFAMLVSLESQCESFANS